MSPAQLPSWLRAFARWQLNRRLVKSPISLLCPRCRQPIVPALPLPDSLWDTLVECRHCGHAMSVLAITAGLRKTPEELVAEGVSPEKQPPGSRITVEDNGTERIWRIPAKGGCNVLLVFATLWLLFIAFFVAVGVWAMIYGEGESRADALGIMWVLLVFSLFVATGLWMFYQGLEKVRARHTVRVNAAEFVHERHFLGRTTRKAWPRQDIQSVDIVVFHTENYKAIHGIEVRRAQSCIRFGATLDAMDKAWLCRDLRLALGLASAPTVEDDCHRQEVLREPLVQISDPRGPEVLHVEMKSYGCDVTIPPSKGGWFMVGIGAFVMAIGGFMIHQGLSMWMPAEEEAPGGFRAFWNGFILFWCSGVTMALLAGAGTGWFGWRLARTRERLVATDKGVRIETVIGSRVQEEAWHAVEVRDVSVESAFSRNSNGLPMDSLRGVLVLRDRVRGFGTGHSRRDLEAAAAALRTALGKDQPAS